MEIKFSKTFIHPFLIGIYPILFLYSHNVYDSYISQLFAPLIFISTITIFLIFSLRLLIKNNAKTGIILSFFYIMFFSYGSIFSSIRKLVRRNLIFHIFLICKTNAAINNVLRINPVKYMISTVVISAFPSC